MKELMQLVDKLEEAEKEIKEWFSINVQPKLDKCNSREEVRKLMGEVSYHCCDINGSSRNMPSYIFMQFCCKASLFLRDTPE